ncbi:MAG: alpha/beta fold hydrolase [Dehalococcoidia bacterium]
MPIATINGVALYYERHGDSGEPLVLVHGYTGDITDWRYQLPEFSRTHRLLVFDLRGHGRSHASPDRAAYAILQMADDVEALAAHAGFARYHLLGHSMGGAIVQEIALRSPARLLSLTLEDTSYRFGLARDGAIAQWIAQRHKMAEEQGMAAVADFPSVLPPPPHMPAERLAETKQRLTRMSVDAFIGAWQALDAWPGTEDRLGAISAPTLIICGDLDLALVAPSKTLAAAIPGATIEIVPECGHSPQYERPDLFNAALRPHLERHAAAAK